MLHSMLPSRAASSLLSPALQARCPAKTGHHQLYSSCESNRGLLLGCWEDGGSGILETHAAAGKLRLALSGFFAAPC